MPNRTAGRVAEFKEINREILRLRLRMTTLQRRRGKKGEG